MFGRDFTMNVSHLQHLITRAVEPYTHEPNYAAHLEVAEYINNKKANTPREAAMTIVRLVNNRNPHISILALALLETLVQSCGYPFHLQISTKEFLNELVRRFPERPPPFPGPVMSKILDLIHTWKETICVESKWREDLGNIRDMHRLLTFKGYRFREVPRPQAAVASTSNLKSADELEEEDRLAQSAKLQELIRRGTPRDLAAAQELMKSLAGADPERKPDYRTQSITELNKLDTKVILLNDMLDNVDTQRGERFVSGDVYDQVSSILIGARPKIQKWISDAEANDPEMLDIFLQMNDRINSVLNRYESFKKGDYVAAANPVPAEYAGSSRTTDTSLIDFDDSAPAPSGAPVDDLAGLFDPSPAAPAPASNLIPGYSFTQSMSAPQPQLPNGQPQFGAGTFGTGAQIPGQGFASTAPPPSSSPFGAIMLPGTPKLQDKPRFGGADGAFNQGGGGTMGQVMGAMNPSPPSGTGFSMGGLPVSASPAVAHHQQQQQGKDPFADLVGLF